MRMAWLSMAAVLAAAGGGRAAEPLRDGTVVYDSIQLKAGPGLRMASCGTLKKGQLVVVHHEDNEFYAILPPEGCTSFINHRFLGKVDSAASRQNAVLASDAAVYLGGESAGPTAVSQVTLPKGEIVELIGTKVTFENSNYYPILPPRGEYRYVPKKSVTLSAKPSTAMPPAEGSASVADRSRGGVPAMTASRTAPQSNNIGSGSGLNHASWAQADHFYQNGEYSKAEELFRQIYLDMNKSSDYSYDDKLLCYNRRMKCVEMIGAGRGPSDDVRASGAPKSSGAPRSSEKPDDGARETTSRPLTLRKAQFTLDGKATYALVTDRGDVAYYATLQPGVSVDSLIGKVVEATGTPKARGDLGVPFLIVSRVSAVR